LTAISAGLSADRWLPSLCLKRGGAQDAVRFAPLQADQLKQFRKKWTNTITALRTTVSSPSLCLSAGRVCVALKREAKGFGFRRIATHCVQGQALVAALGAADTVIFVDPNDLTPIASRNVAQLALLVGRGLVDCRDAEIENCSSHG
jgi:hypothetical protein